MALKKQKYNPLLKHGFQEVGDDEYTNAEPTLTALGGIPSGSTFDKLSNADMWNALLYPYMAPVVSFAVAPANSLREKGVIVSSPITLTATVTKKSRPIQNVKYYKGTGLIAENKSPNPNGGKDSAVYNSSITENTTLKVVVSDGQSSKEASQSYSFVYPYYYLKSSINSTPGEAELKGSGGTKVVANKGVLNLSFSGEYIYPCFAIPASWGEVKSIVFGPNDYLGSFRCSIENFIQLDGAVVQYRVYTQQNAVTDMAGFTYKISF